MEDGVDSSPSGEQEDAALKDLTAMPLSELVTSADSVLDRALRRLLVELDGPQEHYTAFGNVPR